MKIHTFGDSHSVNGWDTIDHPIIYKHHLGAKLCYSIGINNINMTETKKLYNSDETISVEDGDVVIFSLGEIDCRCHIHKHINDKNTYMSIIDEIVKNYAIAIETSISGFKNLIVCIYNVVPPVNKHNCHEYAPQPFLGSDEERKQYVLYFNKKLREVCMEKKYIFFDIYDKYTDEFGFLSKALSDDNVHIKDGKYIKEFLTHHVLCIEEVNK